MNKFCCKSFEDNRYIFDWFKTEDDEYYCLPYVQDLDDKIKALYCPFCGADLSGIMITKEEWLYIKELNP